MSRQREWQLKMREQGRCTRCGKDAHISKRNGVSNGKSNLCTDCAKKQLAYSRKYQGVTNPYKKGVQ